MKMHSEHVTIQTAERRKKAAEDVERRRLYRVAHGLEEAREGDKEKLGELRKKVLEEGGQLDEVEVKEVIEQPKRRREVKKWLGIW